MNKDRFRFRVWDKEQQIMIIYDSPGDYDTLSAVLEWTWDGTCPDNYILMQCTGLRNSEGTLIWEGDLLKDLDFHRHGIVIWDNRGFGVAAIGLKEGEYNTFYDSVGLLLSWGNTKVIGNIYENPELLK